VTFSCRTAGLTLEVEADGARWGRFVQEACAGQLLGQGPADVHVSVSTDPRPFDLTGLDPLTRGAWSDGATVVMHDACSSGADLRLRPGPAGLEVEARARPAPTTRALTLLAPSRAQLLWRAAMLQYPALWWAGVRGAVPLHVSALRVGGVAVVLAGPGGVGKSTLLRDAMVRSAVGVSDNVCVTDGTRVHGLLEPLRGTDGTGRRMPHGRREEPWRERLDALDVDRVLVLQRGSGEEVRVSPTSAADAARVMTAGTYAAGELRRYCAFAATLALATGIGPAHPPVEDRATVLAGSVPCARVTLPAGPGTAVEDLLLEPASGS